MANVELSLGGGWSEQIKALLIEEGLAMYRYPDGVQKTQGLIKTSIDLFRFVLHDQDPRWNLAYAYWETREKIRCSPLTCEIALLATYLSRKPSYRNGYSSYQREPNIRQLARAIQNLQLYPTYRELFARSSDFELPPEADIQFVRTDRILKGKNKEGITGCPEALYQLRLFVLGKYLGRIGFNGHVENGITVNSITNVQGIPEGCGEYVPFEDQSGIGPFNLLVRRLKAMVVASDKIMVLRGLKNPSHEGSECLYNALFRCEKIPRLSFKRN